MFGQFAYQPFRSSCNRVADLTAYIMVTYRNWSIFLNSSNLISSVVDLVDIVSRESNIVAYSKHPITFV